MTRRVAAWALATFVLVGAVTSSEAAEPADVEAPIGAEAMWAWDWDSPEELTRFALEQGMSRIYLYCQGGFDRRVRETIAALGSAGIEVEALGGESRWATTQRRDMLRFVRAARRYERDAPPSAPLSGIHLDVEPYGLRAWDREGPGTARALVRSLAAARRAAAGVPLRADIPFWFDEIRVTRSMSLAERIMRSTDGTTVMAYRDEGIDIVDVARREVRIAGRLGKSVTVGVETAEVDPEQVTFFEEGRAALEASVAFVQREFAADAGFEGIAVHQYESLRALPNG